MCGGTWSGGADLTRVERMLPRIGKCKGNHIIHIRRSYRNSPPGAAALGLNSKSQVGPYDEKDDCSWYQHGPRKAFSQARSSQLNRQSDWKSNSAVGFEGKST